MKRKQLRSLNLVEYEVFMQLIAKIMYLHCKFGALPKNCINYNPNGLYMSQALKCKEPKPQQKVDGELAENEVKYICGR